MTTTDLIALSPLSVIAITALVVLLMAAFSRHHWLAAGVTLGGLLLAFATFPWVSAVTPRPITSLLVLDQFGLFYMALLFLASFGVVVFSYHYIETWEGNHEEFYVLLLLATLGASVLVASNHFVSLFQCGKPGFIDTPS